MTEREENLITLNKNNIWDWLQGNNGATIHFTSISALRGIVQNGRIRVDLKDTGLHGGKSKDGLGGGGCQRMKKPGVSAIYIDVNAEEGSFHDLLADLNWYSCTISASDQVVGLEIEVKDLKIYDYNPFNPYRKDYNEAKAKLLANPEGLAGRWTRCEHCIIGEIPIDRIKRCHFFEAKKHTLTISFSDLLNDEAFLLGRVS